MSIRDLICDLQELQVQLNLNGDELELQFPTGQPVPYQLINDLRSRKPEIISYIKENTGKNKVETAIAPVAPNDLYPVSNGQKRLWVLNQFEKEQTAFTIFTSFTISGILDKNIFLKAFAFLVDRHEILRTTFQYKNNELYQKVAPHSHYDFANSFIDISSDKTNSETQLAQLKKEITHKGFNLEKGPLFKFYLVKKSEAEHYFLFSIAHIISDAWSMSILNRELLHCYHALSQHKTPELEPLRIQYKDYVHWLNKKLSGESLDKLKTYWQDQFKDNIPVLELPSQKERPEVKSFRGGFVEISLEEEVSNELRTLARAYNGTIFMTLMATTYVFLHKLTSQEDIVIGTTVAGRNHSDLEAQLGFFVNTLALRTQLNGTESFEIFVQKTIKNFTQALAHQEYPFDMLVEDLQLERDMGRSPLFDVLVEMSNAGDEIAGYTTSHENMLSFTPEKVDIPVTQYDLSFKFFDREQIGLRLEYSLDIFTAKEAERFALYYKRLVKLLVQNEKNALKDFSLLTTSETFNLLENGSGNQTQIETSDFLEIWDATIKKFSKEPAYSFNQTKVSFENLEAHAKKFAAHVATEYNISKGDVIAVCMESSEWLIPVIIGIIKSGAAFLPLSKELPSDRKAYILKDAQAKLLVTDSNRMFDAVEFYNGPLFSADIQMDSLPPVSKEIDPVNTQHTPLYIIYTSGSTGVPKGVAVGHESLINYTTWANNYYFDGVSGYNMPLFTSLSFDLTLTTIFTTLLRGDCIHVLPDDELHKNLEKIFSIEDIRAIKMTPGQLEVLQDVQVQSNNLSCLILGGESVGKKHITLASSLFPNLQIYNEYGPTEATIGCTVKKLSITDEVISIGAPIDNVNVSVRDAWGQVVPQGVTGELYIEGKALAIEYLNQEQQTAQAFITDEITGKRNYKTGDLCRWLPDYTLQYIGRKDDQVKLRGYRISLGDIEYQLKAHESVKDAVVLIKEITSSKKLVAYLLLDNPVDNTTIQKYLAQTLPGYMIPELFVEIEEIPLTTNGKRAINKLPDVTAFLDVEKEYLAPQTPNQQLFVELWQVILNNEKVGITDNFFSLGGDSIKAIRLVSRFAGKTGIELEVKDVFQYQTIDSLAAYAENLQTDHTLQDEKNTWKEHVNALGKSVINELKTTTATHQNWEDAYPMSEIEKGMIFHNFLNKDTGVYHDQFYYQFIDTSFDLNKFQKSFQLLTQKHEILRSSYNMLDFEEPVHLVHAYTDAIAKIDFIDIASIAETGQKEYLKTFMAKDRERGFSVEEPGLWNVTVFKVHDKEYGILWSFHHAIIDGWSNASFITELSNIYFNLKENSNYTPEQLDVSYKDYIIDQLRIKNNENIRNFWKDYLNEYQRTELPFNRSYNAAELNFNVNTHSFALGNTFTEALKSIASNLNVGVKEVFLAAFLYLLKFTNRAEAALVIGLVSNGRPEIEKGDQILGCFLNTIPFKQAVSLSTNPSQFISTVAKQVYALKAYDKMPLQEIVKITGESQRSRNPYFDIMFNYVDFHIHSQLHEQAEGGDNLVDNFENTNTYFDLNINNTGNSITVAFNYADILYSADEIKSLQIYFERILHYFVEDKAIGPMDIMGADETNKVLFEFNNTTRDFPSEKTLIDLFKQQVAQNPDKIAIAHENECITFGELEARSTNLAMHINKLLPEEGDSVIGVMMEASIERIISILATLKSGNAYLPIDVDFPEKRKEYILSEAGVNLIFSEEEHLPDTLQEKRLIINKQKIQTLSGNTETVSTLKQTSNHNTAYVIYTSGSTGNPKGVMVPHKGAVNRVDWMWKAFDFNAEDNIIQKTPLTFDVSVWELFLPLCYGAKMTLCPKEAILDIALYNRIVSQHRVTTTHFVPSLFSAFLESNTPCTVKDLKTLTRIFCSGEALEPALVAKNNELTGVPVYNLYGPTEASVDVSYYHTKKQDQVIPIGKPIANTQLYILDKEMNPVPPNIKGEIYIGGVGLAKGYINQPELTARQFVVNPFEPSTKLYRTGDLGEWRTDGNIVYKGRVDFQLKINGVRLEPTEIEKQIVTYPGAQNAVVIYHDTKLTAYVKSIETLDFNALRSFLKERLPAYTVPSFYVQIDEMPLTHSGKIDRKALLKLKPSQENKETNHENLSALQKDLLSIWQKTLGDNQLGIEDNFFDKGGDSIKVIQIISRMGQAGYHTTMKDIFDYPTILELTSEVKSMHREIDQSTITGKVTPSPIQQSFLNSDRKYPHHFNQSVMLMSEQRLSTEALESVLKELHKHHDLLRARFTNNEGTIIQEITGINDNIHLDTHDLKEVSHPKQLLETKAKEYQASIDLENGPLFKTIVFHLPEKDYLLLIGHHLIIDGVSWRILLEDFQQLYNAAVAGKPYHLPLKTDAFGSYTNMLHDYANSANFKDEYTYWNNIDEVINETTRIDTLATNDNKIGDSEGASFKLTQQETEELQQKVNYIFGTNTQEILLVALALAIQNVFKNDKIPVMLEGHGRELLHKPIDVSRTIGWFTSVFPVVLETLPAHDYTRQIKEIKEMMRAVPVKGIGYGLLDFLKDENLGSKNKPQIIFNYLGKFDTDLKNLSFELADVSPGNTVHLDEQRLYALDFSAWIIEDCLEVSVSYGRNQFSKNTMEHFITCFQQTLQDIIARTQGMKEREISPSDFSNTSFSIDELENIFD